MKRGKHGVAVAVVVVMMFAGVVGCAQDHEDGQVVVRVETLSSAAAITRMTLSAQPDDVRADLVNRNGVFTGSVSVPPGEHTFSIDAFAGDTLVGHGEATATIVSAMTTALQITVLDTTPDAPNPGHAPFVLSFMASNAEPHIGEAVALSASAVDPDGDAIAYAWTSTCGGQFDRTDAASVSWVGSTAGACTLRLDVTAGTQTVTRTVNLFVVGDTPRPGAVDVTATFAAKPVINAIGVFTLSDDYACEVRRDQADASCPDPVDAGGFYSVGTDAGFVALRDNCGGRPESAFAWTAPKTPGTCLLTATKTNEHGLSASLTIALLVR